MRPRAISGLAVMLLVAAAASAALAADGGGNSALLTATITAGAIGSRSVTTVSPITMSSALNSSTLQGTYSVVVTESARTGTNPWSVTGALTDLTDSSSPPNTISKSNVTVSGRAVTQVAGGGTSSAPSGSEDLSAARTLWTTTGQNTTTVYTGTYTGTGTLTLSVPNETKAGVYTATFTVTLVQ